MQLPSDSTPFEYVYLAGMAHSGSTLIAFLLNAHPEICSPGEVELVGRNMRHRWETGRGRCSCGRAFRKDPFWIRTLAGMAARGEGLDEAGFYNTGRIRRAASQARLAAFPAAALDVSGKHVLLDVSKKAAHLPALQRNPLLDLRVINLYRDGRGVVNSWRKRNPDTPVSRLTRQWVWRERRRALALRAVPLERQLTLRYEDLARDPLPVLRAVFRFLGVDEEVEVVEGYKSKVEHHITGNRMRLNDIEGIRYDEKWRQKLDPALLDDCTRAGGLAMNRKIGYTDG